MTDDFDRRLMAASRTASMVSDLYGLDIAPFSSAFYLDTWPRVGFDLVAILRREDYVDHPAWRWLEWLFEADPDAVFLCPISYQEAPMGAAGDSGVFFNTNGDLLYDLSHALCDLMAVSGYAELTQWWQEISAEGTERPLMVTRGYFARWGIEIDRDSIWVDGDQVSETLVGVLTTATGPVTSQILSTSQAIWERER